MLAGQSRPFPAQMSRPGRTGPSRTVGGLIRERPVFVNVVQRRNCDPLKRRNWREYTRIRGVFPCEDGWLAFRSVAAGLDSVIAEDSMTAEPGQTRGFGPEPANMVDL
jgi:hypothetical protein